jgi:hypothetical protein
MGQEERTNGAKAEKREPHARSVSVSNVVAFTQRPTRAVRDHAALKKVARKGMLEVLIECR